MSTLLDLTFIVYYGYEDSIGAKARREESTAGFLGPVEGAA